jgi:hypothetical protein
MDFTGNAKKKPFWLNGGVLSQQALIMGDSAEFKALHGGWRFAFLSTIEFFDRPEKGGEKHNYSCKYKDHGETSYSVNMFSILLFCLPYEPKEARK